MNNLSSLLKGDKTWLSPISKQCDTELVPHLCEEGCQRMQRYHKVDDGKSTDLILHQVRQEKSACGFGRLSRQLSMARPVRSALTDRVSQL